MIAESIKIFPSPVLRKTNQNLTSEEIKSTAIKQLVDSMFSLMYQANGVGLAAPQVGFNLRFTVIDTKKHNGPLVVFNPYIINSSYRKNTQEEGCLSLPGLYAKVKRPTLITIKYLDINGQEKILKADSFLSRVLQHEIDHLDGTLFIDRSDQFSQGSELLEKWQQDEKPLLDIAYPYSY